MLLVWRVLAIVVLLFGSGVIPLPQPQLRAAKRSCCMAGSECSMQAGGARSCCARDAAARGARGAAEGCAFRSDCGRPAPITGTSASAAAQYLTETVAFAFEWSSPALVPVATFGALLRTSSPASPPPRA